MQRAPCDKKALRILDVSLAEYWLLSTEYFFSQLRRYLMQQFLHLRHIR